MSTQATNIAGMDAATMLHLGRTVTIASFWPQEKVVERRFKSRPDGGFFTAYTIPACPSDAKEPILLRIGDALELHNLGGATTDGTSKSKMMEAPVPGGAMEIAKDIINATRKSAVGVAEGMHPAIWICAGDAPTPEESAKWRSEQESYFRALVAQADDAFFGGHKEAISTLHKMAAEWLRLDPRKHEWVRAPQRGDVKPCPFCRTPIDAQSLKCEKCGEIVDAQRYAEMKKVAAEAQAYLAENAPQLVAGGPVRPLPGKPVAAGPSR